MTSPRVGRFRPADRLLKSRNFTRTQKRGRRLRSKNFVISLASRDPAEDARGSEAGVPGGRRLGITVSRKVGNSVVRNRVKRRIREWFRTSRDGLDDGIDLVVIARSGAAEQSGPSICRELSTLLRISRGES